MFVALPCQAHVEGLSVCSEPSGLKNLQFREVYLRVGRGSPPARLIHYQDLGAQPALKLWLQQQFLLFLFVVGLGRWGTGGTGGLRLRAQLF